MLHFFHLQYLYKANVPIQGLKYLGKNDSIQWSLSIRLYDRIRLESKAEKFFKKISKPFWPETGQKTEATPRTKFPPIASILIARLTSRESQSHKHVDKIKLTSPRRAPYGARNRRAGAQAPYLAAQLACSHRLFMRARVLAASRRRRRRPRSSAGNVRLAGLSSTDISPERSIPPLARPLSICCGTAQAGLWQRGVDENALLNFMDEIRKLFADCCLMVYGILGVFFLLPLFRHLMLWDIKIASAHRYPDM